MRKYGVFLLVVLINIVAASAEAYTNGFDKSPPESYMESVYGWYDHEVTARLEADDAFSGIAALSYMIDGSHPAVSYTGSTELRLRTEGVHWIEYSSMDNAGNTEKPKISLVKIDFTAPELSIVSPAQRSYLHSDIIVLDFSGTDALSGIFSITGKIDWAPVARSQEFDMLTLTPGFHEFEAIAIDNAGNIRTSKVNFTVISNIDSLIALNDRAIRNGWVYGADTANSLMQKLALAKQKIEAGQNEYGNSILKSYMSEIDSQRGKNITEHGYDILTNEAAFVYIFNV